MQKMERKEKAESPPQLYDLTALQRDANRLLGFTAQQTLDYAQSLYEKRLITYPRTDSRFLTEDMAASLPGLVTDTGRAFAVEEPIPIHVQQVIDGSKVTDHHALLPTKSMANADLAALPAGERNVLRLIAARLLCAVGEPHRYAETTLTTICAGEEFTAKGNLLQMCSNNLNQYAKAANENGRVYAADMEDLRQRLDELIDIGKQILSQLAEL